MPHTGSFVSYSLATEQQLSLITLHTILLGVGGIIYRPHMLELLQNLSLDRLKAIKLTLKLHAHSVLYAYKLVSTQRALEESSDN